VSAFAFALGLGLGLGPGLATAAAAEDADAPEEKKARAEVDAVSAVTLSRTTVFRSPRAVSAVERDEMRVRPPRATGDALIDEDGVFVQRSSYGFAMPSIRGLGEGHVLILIDGIRLNSTITSTLPGGVTSVNMVDPYTLDAIEVVRGPGLAAYGSDGLGGTIQLRTRKPAPIAGSNIELNAGVRGIYSSYDQSFAGSISGGGRWNRFALDTAFSARRFGDLTGGDRTGLQPFTGYNEGGLSLGGGVDLGRGTLVLVYQGVRQYDGLRSERSRPDDLYLLSEIRRDLAYLRYDGIFEVGGRNVEASATASYQRQGETANRQIISQDQSLRSDNQADVLGVTANARADLGRGGQFSGGVDGYFEWVSSIAERGTVSGGTSVAPLAAPELARYPGGSTAQTVALFVQDELDLDRLAAGGKDPARPGRLKLLLGGRVGANVLSIGRDDRAQRLLGTLAPAVLAERTIVNPIYSGSVHLRYELYPGLAAIAGVLTSVRPANLDDYARLDGGRPGLILPTTDVLRRETAYTAEAGFRAAYQRIESSAVYAFTYLDSPLSVVPVVLMGQACQVTMDGHCIDRFFTRRSEPSALLHSVEASARIYLFGGLSVVGSLSYTHADVNRQADPVNPARSEPLWRVPPLYGMGALQLRRPRNEVLNLVEVSLRWAAPQNRLSSQDLYDSTICLPNQVSCTHTPGFLVVSARTALRLSRRMYLTAALENITNASYRLHGSGISGPGLGGNVSFEGNYQ
jgi:outer membrane receptor protein involved in Fe transport